MARNTRGEATHSSQQPATTECNDCGGEFAEAGLFLTDGGSLLCNECREHDEPDFDTFPLDE